jgi:septal ring factor EnvC (AmiA/AmiB activator)
MPNDEPCTRPPAGWRCTRGRHIVGPCAAVPVSTDVELSRELLENDTALIQALTQQLNQERIVADQRIDALTKQLRWHRKRWGQQSQTIGRERAEHARTREALRESDRALGLQGERITELYAELAWFHRNADERRDRKRLAELDDELVAEQYAREHPVTPSDESKTVDKHDW